MIPPALLSDLMTTLDRPNRREVGRALRRRGLSYGEIGALTAVPKSTIAYWCRGMTLSEEARRAVDRRTGSKVGVPRDTQRRRREEIEQIRAEARREAETLLQDPLWTAGVTLYWAEGSKTDRRLELVNADPAALRLFMRWAQRYLIEEPRWVAVVTLHADNDIDAAVSRWMQRLDLPRTCFNRPYVKPDGTGHRKNHLPHGVCRVRARASTDAWIRTLEWIDVLASEWGGFPALVTSRAGR